ncbi:dTDP-4-dehydrorhamnose 3,5-epimerase [Pseudorhizobium halotolerans]|uniref:dTDP-4-dehydrorhamnose 3,5-epimerase n=1 Tax=Pseudorhizobium halotolerans TaxID=1233081 RepID=A0ABM8PWI2_9HYPH|nr:dTDP-4-dehydrorhamnose 3,5-epimerase [Pseudorhizobium halotolerans]CAD7052246.1 dTDP-4-dehydrorhamnose 3,5-epimerase [Pseudorhizobium halotolerans]
MRIEPTILAGVVVIIPSRHSDDRGYFCELFCEDFFRSQVADVRFVQDNQSLCSRPATVRGLHYQRSPVQQGKLVTVPRGAIFDVAVDLRTNSSTFGDWFGMVLSAENGFQIWISEGFAHGFMSLEPDTITNYKVTAPYSASHEGGIAWDDPDIGIRWPIVGPVIVSPKDASQPRLKEIHADAPVHHQEVAPCV